MKGHKAHHHAHHAHKAHKSHGGHMDSPKHGDKVHDKDPTEVYAGKGSHVVREADERKHGGRTKKHHAHHAHHEHHEHHEHAHHMHPAKKHKKHVGHAEGEDMKHHAGRKPRKSGGRTGSNMNPLSSAHHGTAPKGRHLEMN